MLHHNGLARLMRWSKPRISALTSGLPGRFPCPIPGERSALPSDDRSGLHDLQTRAPTGPESRQQNPQNAVGALQAQVTRGVGLENGKLVTKSENFGLQGGADSKTRGNQSQKCDENRVAHGDDYGLTNGRKLCVFRLDGVFGTDRKIISGLRVSPACR